jgi:hypothetical protein
MDSCEDVMRRSALCLMLLPALAACHAKEDARLAAIENRLDRIEKTIGQHDAVILKPGQTGYSLLATDLGRVAVAIADVQPYAGGSRVTLDFGNPTSARLTGMKARIEWGATDAHGLPKVGGNVRSVSFTAAEPLPPGSWRQYKIDLPGVPPAQLGWLRVAGFDSGTVDLLSQ